MNIKNDQCWSMLRVLSLGWSPSNANSTSIRQAFPNPADSQTPTHSNKKGHRMECSVVGFQNKWNDDLGSWYGMKWDWKCFPTEGVLLQWFLSQVMWIMWIEMNAGLWMLRTAVHAWVDSSLRVHCQLFLARFPFWLVNIRSDKCSSLLALRYSRRNCDAISKWF